MLGEYILWIQYELGPLLLTWFNYNPSMDKWLYPWGPFYQHDLTITPPWISECILGAPFTNMV